LSLDLLSTAGLDVGAMITGRVTFEELPEVFESLRHPNAHGKVPLEPFARRNDITTSIGR
jgi:threonine dehydrogenase-like Zn-dependent dehydrogenase